MVAICYLVSSLSRAIISYAPAPHLWILHFQHFSQIYHLLFRINPTQNDHGDGIIAAPDPPQSTGLTCNPLQGHALTGSLRCPCPVKRSQRGQHP
jgi:hypothetical protein